MTHSRFKDLGNLPDDKLATRLLNPLVLSQVAREKSKAILRFSRPLLLGNMFMLFACLSVIQTPKNAGFLASVLTVALVVTIASLIMVTIQKGRNAVQSSPDLEVKQQASWGFALVAFVLGIVWATVPFSLPDLTNGLQITAAGAAVAGMFCIAGFLLAPIPAYAAAFCGPILLACYAMLIAEGGTSSLIFGIALAAYVGFIMIVASAHTRSLTSIVVAASEMAKQQKTISLLLRDFEKHSSDWLWETDNDGRFIHVFDRFAEVSGYPADKLVKMTPSMLVKASDNTHPAAEILLASMERRASFTDLQVPVIVHGEQRWWSITGTPDFDEAGNFSGYHGVGSDITLQKKADERINFLAHNDALTGLYNRAHFTDILGQNVSRLERYGAPFALAFLDLDHFKAVNDSFGHPVGDKLLVEVADRLRREIMPGSIAARLGGDEFAIIIPKSVSTDDMTSLARRLLQAISAEYMIDGEKLKIGVSIGIALAPRHGTRPDQLLRNVDLALYRAKESGRNAFKMFESGMDSLARERRALEFDLRSALEGNELELFYQPLMSSVDASPVGFEALLRWNHPIRGLISPAEFVPIAESTGLIKNIGEWVIREACRTAATWASNLTVAVNLSAPQFDKDRIVDVVAKALANSGLAPHRLELEITESLLIDRPDEVLATLQRLKDLGVSIAMDDFGTGYSSLSYLLKFPFDKIKIDKSFVSAISTDKAACDVLRTIGSLGKSLNVRITAEGVETEEQAEFLRAISCDQLQGYFFAKPLQLSSIPGFLATQTAIRMRAADVERSDISVAA